MITVNKREIRFLSKVLIWVNGTRVTSHDHSHQWAARDDMMTFRAGGTWLPFFRIWSGTQKASDGRSANTQGRRQVRQLPQCLCLNSEILKPITYAVGTYILTFTKFSTTFLSSATIDTKAPIRLCVIDLGMGKVGYSQPDYLTL